MSLMNVCYVGQYFILRNYVIHAISWPKTYATMDLGEVFYFPGELRS